MQLALERVEALADEGGAGHEVAAPVLGVLGLLNGRRLRLARKPADLAGDCVLFGAQALDLGEERAPALVQRDRLVQRRVCVAAGEGPADGVGVLAEEGDGQHVR